jgi:hypothetical protein
MERQGMKETLHTLFGERPQEARRHGPRTRPEFREAVADLAKRGMTLQDIAAVLSLTANGVAELLREYHSQRITNA